MTSDSFTVAAKKSFDRIQQTDVLQETQENQLQPLHVSVPYTLRLDLSDAPGQSSGLVQTLAAWCLPCLQPLWFLGSYLNQMCHNNTRWII